MNQMYNKGFYQVKDKIFLSKFHAIIESQKTGAFPTWNFNDDVFNNCNWLIEPESSLWELYKQRAQQLRNQYDHLVLLFSGGSDSTNILQSFLFNNIPIDEIFVYGPFSSNQGKTSNISTDPSFMYQEIDLVALPYLRELEKQYKFTVTLYDWTDNVVNAFNTADWIWSQVNSRFAPHHVSAKNTLHENSKLSMSKLEKGKKVGFIYGVDKPRIIYKNNTFYLGFLDVILSLGPGFAKYIKNENYIIDEYFYWTPDFPSIVIKQAHTIKNFFVKHPQLKYVLHNNDLNKWIFKEEYYNIVKSLIYPFWNNNLFQTTKPKESTFIELDNWFTQQASTSQKNWLNGLHEANQVIEPHWFNDSHKKVKSGIIGSWSKLYNLGTG
jgi:hypothetical protein